MADQPETAAKKEKTATKAPQHQDSGSNVEFRALFDLEDRYPKADNLFAPSSVASTSNRNVMVSVDTNALLLPYSVGRGNLNAIAEVYQRLAKENRLFLPARAAREFIKNRDRKLAEMIRALDVKFQIAAPTMLDSLSGYKDMMNAADKVRVALKGYDKAKSSIIAGIKNWRGDDPVTKLYHEVFTKDRIMEHDEARVQLAMEWERRAGSQIPPGYKDGGKDDAGIGDFLIWKSILKLGADRKRDLVFVTGETKADWYVRSGGEAVYPRPELVDEYRRFSEGHSIRLMPLADLLDELNAPSQVVEEVRQAEEKANTKSAVAEQLTDWEKFFSTTLAKRNNTSLGPDLFDDEFAAPSPGVVAPDSFADMFGLARARSATDSVWPRKRILTLPGIGPVAAGDAEAHMARFRISPVRRVVSARLGPSVLHLEYGRFLTPSEATEVLSHAREIDPAASWVSSPGR